MPLLNKIGKKYFLGITAVLLVINIVNYSHFKAFNSFRMNDFFAGFFAGSLIVFLLTGTINYTKLKK